jgi:anti-sigma factor RsiW
MNINRHNYEEYFLLYADNELTAEERRMVEGFVLENPDLAEDFQTFQQLTLDPADAPVFFDKSSLLKPVSNEQSTGLSDKDLENLLTYMDQEFEPAAQQEWESKIAGSPRLQEELTVFLKTKLQPDLSVVFPDKNLLYRKETPHTTARVFRLTWVRISAAAAVVLIAGLTWLNNIDMSENAATPSLAVTKPAVSPAQAIPPDGVQMPAEHAGKTVEVSGTQSESLTAGTGDQSAQGRQTGFVANKKERSGQKGAQPVSGDIRSLTGDEPSTEVAMGGHPRSLSGEQGNPATLSATAISNEPAPVSGNLVATQQVLPEDVKTNYATEALLSAHDAVEVVELDNNSSRKGPFRGLVRKANRFLNKVTNPDPDKPSVKVAAFEIALAK